MTYQLNQEASGDSWSASAPVRSSSSRSNRSSSQCLRRTRPSSSRLAAARPSRPLAVLASTPSPCTRSSPSGRCATRSSTSSPACSSSTSSLSSWSSTSSASSSSLSLQLSVVLAWSMTLLLVSSCLGMAEAGTLMGHPFSKRSFMDIQCKGVYDKSLFARLDRICEDCYNLFREPQLHTLCRKNCFTSDYFKGCLDVLLLQDEMEWIQTSIKQLHGADPGV